MENERNTNITFYTYFNLGNNVLMIPRGIHKNILYSTKFK